MTGAVRSFGPVTNGTTTRHPLLIVAALLLASLLVGFDTRVFIVGLSDIRGAYGLSVDEAAWLKTIANAPQILIASAVAWLVTVFGVRKVMIPTALVYAAASLAIPFVDDGGMLFALHALRGLLLGVLIPATIMVIFRNLDRKYWLIGIGIYALRVPLSQNLGFVLVGIYGDDFGWQWIYWQDVVIAPLIAFLLFVAAPKEKVNVGLLEQADWGGMLLLGTSMTMLYVGIDQGDRLGWLQSGIVVSLLAGGSVLAVGFFVNESLVAHPWAHASVILTRNIGLGYAVIICFSMASAGNGIAVSGFLQNVIGLRPIWISGLYLSAAVMPVFFFISVAGLLLFVFDARLCIVMGLLLMALGARLGSELNHDWMPMNFFSTLFFQTAGQSLAFFATVVYLIGNSDPARSTAVAAYIQVLRLGSVEAATSLMSVMLRRREQFHSAVLDGSITPTLSAFHRVMERLADAFRSLPLGQLESLATVAARTRSQAYALAYGDLFTLSFWAAISGLLIAVFLTAMPFGPLHYRFRDSD
ncbi:MFS transporter [Martelella mediterranea]|uniref:Multidrug resistance protein B n=1 Tax=Martelella mediterranea DSM 17316 TaxID=1122214 RepID=A0A1U9Z3F6_9HYPH|nr:MFS transporter [Martelella mediterranea]AQZ52229.1 Multidrug resistance protein B [Martelella mediterranea DSM 17316]